MDIKTNMALLAEAAAIDANLNIVNEANVDAVRESYNSIPECVGITVTEAADVVVTPVAGDYFVEMTNLAPFLLDSGIRSVSKALDMVAEANGLEPKSVGLIIDSQDTVSRMLYESTAKARKTGNDKIRENAISKVSKNIAIAKRLMSEGYKVAKKRSDAKVCSKCGKAKGKCECDGANCSTGSNAVIAEGDDKCTGAECKKEAAILFESLGISRKGMSCFTEGEINTILSNSKAVDRELDKICVGKTERKADELLRKYYEVNRAKFKDKYILGATAAGTAIGGIAGAIAGGPGGAVLVGTTGASLGVFVGITMYAIAVNKIIERIMDLNLEINQKRRTLERMLRDINEDIADVKSTNKNANIESLEKTRANIRANLDRLDAINAERVLNRQNINY